jgi:RNA polymerase sigma-70 factor (ECF subfamily)
MDSLPRELDQFRGYLRTLARLHFHRSLSVRADPSDIVQQALLKAHASRGLFRGTTVEAQAAWLRRILACSLSNFVRDNRRECRDAGRELAMDDLLERSSQALGTLAQSAEPSPSSLVAREDRVLRVATALAELPLDEQVALLLRHCEGLALEEIAARLGVSTKTVARRLRRGTVALRSVLKWRDGAGDDSRREGRDGDG